MATYTTLEEIKAGLHTASASDHKIVLRPEQREAIDRAKSKFCKRIGKKPDYQWEVHTDSRQFLWNAKMRFGKTLCALQLAREMGVKRTLIVTHRPVVNESWKADFKLVMGDKVEGNESLRDLYAYGSLADDASHNVGNYYDLETFANYAPDNHYVFFVSMQYLRLSELVNAKTQAKNEAKQDDHSWGHNPAKAAEKLKADILHTDWDLVVIDEAHEGTRTALGKRVIDEYLRKKHTKMLHLSGTPFNLYEDFSKDEIFTWDYIEEQTAKREFAAQHPDEKNPYAELPQMRIMTYDISANLQQVIDQEGVFSFTEFFRTWTGNPKADHASMPDGCRGRFVHEAEVQKFLDLLCTKDATSNFPFSTSEYRAMFRHTLWVVSHVNEARALEQLLRQHHIFGKNNRFQIINVAGNGADDEANDNALDKVNSAIGDDPSITSTITISCGRLTTGVTVRPWTAVLYLKGGDNAATYMQTIFRVQSPYTTKDGRMKTTCYVFDFAPDRTLKVIAHTAKFSSMTKAHEKKRKADNDDDLTQEQRDKQTIAAFMQLCPLISMDGGQMTELDVNSVYKQLENVFIDRLVRKGFDDPCLYNQEELNKIDQDLINSIGEHGGQAPDERRKEAGHSIDVSHMTPEQRKAYEAMVAQKKKDAEERVKARIRAEEEFRKKWEAWSEEKKQEYLKEQAEHDAHLEELRRQREEFKKRVTNIRGIALRIPLLMYGGADAGDPKDELTVDNFTRKIKDESWAEFMPKGITKEDFNKIKRCFNATRFTEAGKRYRALTREADFMHVDERIQQITEIFSYFRNPDKETVLTPWRVVNMHLSDTIGGYCFFDETFDEQTGWLLHPRYVEQGDVTRQLFDTVDLGGELPTKILEINSKTGLYPLYVTYSLFRRRLREYAAAQCIDLETISVQEEQVVWDDVVANNMYVICNTPMAVGITHRTLFGFRPIEKKANIKNVQLIERASKEQAGLIHDLKSVGFWKGNTSKQEMKFNAVVGNPPYQVMDGGGAGYSALPVYQTFVNLSRRLSPIFCSLIIPARWYAGGKGLDTFRTSMLEDKHLSHLYDFPESKDCFPSADIAGGICYFLWNTLYHGDCLVTNIHNNRRSLYLRDLNEFDIFVRQSDAIQTIKKVLAKKEKTFNQIVFSRRPFGLSNNFVGAKEPSSNSIRVFGSSGISYTDEKHIPQNKELIPKWKVIASKASAQGGRADKDGMRKVLPKVMVLDTKTVCTETYLLLFATDNSSEAKNVKAYVSTKFFRFLLSLKVITQNISKECFSFVPLQEFTPPNSDIDWSRSIADIDRQLYAKYGLTDDEIAFIEKTIKPME